MLNNEIQHLKVTFDVINQVTNKFCEIKIKNIFQHPQHQDRHIAVLTVIRQLSLILQQ